MVTLKEDKDAVSESMGWPCDEIEPNMLLRKGGPGASLVQAGTGKVIVVKECPISVPEHWAQKKVSRDASCTLVAEGNDVADGGNDVKEGSVLERHGKSTCPDGDEAEEIGKGEGASDVERVVVRAG